MKKYLFLVVVLIIVGNACNAEVNSVRKPGQPVKVKIQRHCDFGFGVCIVFFGSRVSGIDESIAEAEATYSNLKLNLVFKKEELSDKLLKQFEDHSTLPVDEDISLPDELIESLGLPSTALLSAGNYDIEKDADSFTVAITILK